MEHRHSVVELVLRDHEQARSLFAGVDVAGTDQLVDTFRHLREALVRHEAAEELVVYPAFRRHVRGANAIADACIEEQAGAEATLAELDRDPEPTEAFRAKLAALRDAVLDHARHEERDVLPALAAALSAAELAQLGERYERAAAMAPTHPHPHLPHTPPANRLLGGVTALIDRVKDALRAA